MTTDAAGDIEGGWSRLLAWTAGGGLVLLGGCRLVLTFTLNASGSVAIGSVAVVTAAALACLVGLAWTSWRVHLDPVAPTPHGMALGVSLLAILICIEAFAALTALLLRVDLTTVSPNPKPDLWRTEALYFWHLIDSIPLLRVTQGVQWQEPVLMPSSAGGGLLLVYKILLVAPLLRVGIGTYQMISKRALQKEASFENLVRRKVLRDDDLIDDIHAPVSRGLIAWQWLVVALLLAFPMLIGLMLPLVFEPGSNLDAWVTRWVNGRRLAFLHTAPQWIAAWLLVWLAFGMADELLLGGWRVRRRRELVIMVAWYLATIEVVVLAATAVNLAFLHVGIASVNQQIPPGEQVRATITGYAWHLADALPGPDIPGTLHWTQRYTLVDRWSTILVLLSTLAMVILLLPVFQATRSYAHFARPTTMSDALSGAIKFAELFTNARTAIDCTSIHKGNTANQPRSAAGDARHAAELVVAQLNGVTTLFGHGEVTRHADAAAAALRSRSHQGRFGQVQGEHHRLRKEEECSFTAFGEAARQALHATSERIRTIVGRQGND